MMKLSCSGISIIAVLLCAAVCSADVICSDPLHCTDTSTGRAIPVIDGRNATCSDPLHCVETATGRPIPVHGDPGPAMPSPVSGYVSPKVAQQGPSEETTVIFMPVPSSPLDVFDFMGMPKR